MPSRLMSAFDPLRTLARHALLRRGNTLYATAFDCPWGGWASIHAPAFTTRSAQAARLFHWLRRHFRSHRADGIFTHVLPADGSWHPFEATRRPHPRIILLRMDGITGGAGRACLHQSGGNTSPKWIGCRG